jgi:hypothetical protein
MTTLRDLVPHPGQPVPGIAGIRVESAFLADGVLDLTYRLTGDLSLLRLPARHASARADDLWRHTCFEAFIMGEDRPAYRELNFSPSGQWQAFAFRNYREPASPPPDVAPAITASRAAHGLTLRARVPRAQLPPGARLRLGLSAVLETTDGALSYWALRHAPGRPDFHHPDAFTLEMDPP